MDWQPYDPTWLAKLAAEQEPDEAWLPEALMACTQAWRADKYRFYFVDPKNPNEPGSEWQFVENFVLEDPEQGDVVLDVLEDHQVGGLELLTQSLTA